MQFRSKREEPCLPWSSRIAHRVLSQLGLRKRPLLSSLARMFLALFVSWQGIAAAVDFPDANLEVAVRAELLVLEIEPGDIIEESDLVGVGFTTLFGDFSSISDLTGLEAALDLTQLFLNDNAITDLTPLAGLTFGLAL